MGQPVGPAGTHSPLGAQAVAGRQETATWSGREGASRCGGSGTRGPSDPRPGRRAHPAFGAGFVAAASTRLVPTPALFPRMSSGRFHPPHTSAPRCSWRTPLAGTLAAHPGLLPLPGERGTVGSCSQRRWVRALAAQMTWGFPGIEIAAGSGPLKLLKRRKRKGGSEHTPHLPTPPPPQPRPRRLRPGRPQQR